MPETANTFRIPKHRRHVPVARSQVRKALADWGIADELADDVTLAANELVTNAVTHCQVSYAQVKVKLTLQGPYLFLEVYDPDRDRLPAPRDCAPDGEGEGEGGRGLVLVGRLAGAWGHAQQKHTKCVWARFTLPERTHVPAAL